VVDNLKIEVMASAQQQGSDPLAFVRNTKLFGDLATKEGFTIPYLATLSTLRKHGSAQALNDLKG
jgi:mannitol 2-dehydrogenase